VGDKIGSTAYMAVVPTVSRMNELSFGDFTLTPWLEKLVPGKEEENKWKKQRIHEARWAFR
jgi:hypothetical protein